MQLDNDARSLIAAQYVLGVLPARTARRFESLRQRDSELDEQTLIWERELAGLGALAPERIPGRALRRRVLDAVQAEVEPARGRGSLLAIWNSLFLWRGLAMASLAAAAWFGVTAGVPEPMATSVPQELAARGAQEITRGATPVSTSAPHSDLLSVLHASGESGVWLVKVDRQAGRLNVRVLEASEEVARAFELWLLPKGQGAPRSLGLLPTTDAGTLRLPREVRDQLDQGRALAVSLEPPGGSPTGLPTGPVVYQGSIIEL